MSNFDNIVEIEKYNHYHDELGRFTFAPGGGSGGSGGPTHDCYGNELSEGQKKYFANSKAVDEDGDLVEVYHGTVHDFTEFDTSLANPENDMGMGIYLTNNYEDVDANYANEEGPDLQIKIEQYSEYLIDGGADFDEADQLARDMFITAEPQTFTCYVNIENPVKLGGKNETIFDYNDGYDPETDEYGEESGTLLDFHQALTDAAYSGNYEIYDADGFLGEVQAKIFEDAYDGISAADVSKIVKEQASYHEVYMESSYGDYKSAGAELLRETFENMGYDGIIDSTVSDKFARMEGMDEDTVHYIVFNSNQVKLVENTNPTNSPDITKSLRKARGEGYALYNLSKVDQEIFQALTRKAWDGEKRDLSKLNKAERGVLEKLMEKAGKHKAPRVSKALLFWDFINKKNPYHDKLGRFTTAANAVGAGANSMIRTKAPPKKTKVAYKVFCVKDGKLYPPMVANPGAQDTPVGVWLDAQEGKRAGESKTGRPQVKAGGKGTKGGSSGTLAYRPGWHLGELPKADQFYTKDKVTGEKLQYENFVWAECDIAADIDYQEEAMSYGYTKNGKFRHSYAGLPKLPTDGCYKYRTNPDPNTKAWYITGAMKVNRILTDDETDAILRAAGEVPMKRKGGKLDLEALGIKQTDFTGTKKSAGTAKSFYDALQLTPKNPQQNNLSKSTETEQEFNIFKTDEDKRLVFGWANVAKTADGTQIEDWQRDIIDPEDLEEAVYKYVLNFRDGGEEHIPSMRKKASLVESVMFTKEKMKAMGIPEGIVPEGWWIGFYVKDDDAWSRIKDGTYKMFSIEGRAIREEVEQPAYKRLAKSFAEIIGKFNPYHDHLGRFTTGDGAASFTMRTKDPKKQHLADAALDREKKKTTSSAASNKPAANTKPRELSSEKEFDEFASHYKDYENSLTTPELNAVRRYQSASFGFNTKLRTGEDCNDGSLGRQATDEEYKGLDSALDKCKVHQDVVVYRGIPDIAAFDDIESMVGKRIVDKGYCSTSLDKKIATDSYYGVEGYVCKINVKAGSKGAYISGVDDEDGFTFTENREILLPRNSTFTIKSVKKIPGYNEKGIAYEVEMDYE